MPKEQQTTWPSAKAERTEELQLATAEAPDITTLERLDAPAIWDGFRAELEKIKSTAETLTVTSVDQKKEMALARDTRLALKKIRIAVEHKRKELVEGLKKKSSAIDGDARSIRVVIEALETRLEEQEEFALRAEADRVAKLQSERSEKLRSLDVDPNFYPKLGEMPDTGFAQMVESFEVAAQLARERAEKEEAARVAEAKAAEEARLAKEKADAEERARIAAENENLRKEAAEKEAALKAEREAEAKARVMAMEEIKGIQQQAIIAVAGRAGVRKGGTMQCLQDTLKETEEWSIDDRFGAFKPAAQSAKDAAISAIKGEIKGFTDRQAAAAAAAKAEAEAEAAEKARKEAAEAARKEALRLQGIADVERQKQAEAHRVEMEKAKAEREAAEAMERLEREKIAAAAKKDRQARDQMAAEVAALAKKEQEVKAAEYRAAAAAAKAPDREKLLAIASKLQSVTLPGLATKEGRAVLAEVIALLEKKAGAM